VSREALAPLRADCRPDHERQAWLARPGLAARLMPPGASSNQVLRGTGAQIARSSSPRRRRQNKPFFASLARVSCLVLRRSSREAADRRLYV
jgi:hypothetical protein